MFNILFVVFLVAVSQSVLFKCLYCVIIYGGVGARTIGQDKGIPLFFSKKTRKFHRDGGKAKVNARKASNFLQP